MSDFITLQDLARAAGVRPQALHNLRRQGYLKVEKQEIVREVFVVSKDEAQRYLDGRKDRADRKAAKIQAELEG